MRVAIALAVVAGGLVASAPAPACGCGIALDSAVSRERALIVHAGGRERLVMSFDLLARGDRPAVACPYRRARRRLRPLSIAFASDRPIYPMKLDRLARSSVAVDLWIVSSGRVRVAGLEDRYAGPVAALRPAVPRRLSSLIGAGYVTRLAATVQPYAIRGDFVAEPATTNAGFRAVVDRVEFTDRTPFQGWARDHLWFVLAGAAGVLAALVLGVRRMRG